MLRDRYSETFAITFSREKGQVYLFIIKYGMWALVRTFVAKDVCSEKIGVGDVLTLLESALNGSESGAALLQSLDALVLRARERVDSKAEEFDIKKVNREKSI